VTIRFSQKLQTYEKRPQIVITDPDQIKEVKSKVK